MEIPDLQKGKLHAKPHLRMLHVPLLMFLPKHLFHFNTSTTSCFGTLTKINVMTPIRLGMLGNRRHEAWQLDLHG